MIAIKGGKLLTVTNGIIEKGNILIENGKITAAGADVAIPEGAEVICAEGCSDGPTFQVRLQIALDIYAVRPEPCMLRRPEPACPDLPLYPPPIRQDPPCWPQCPAGPGPCGWPGRG